MVFTEASGTIDEPKDAPRTIQPLSDGHFVEYVRGGKGTATALILGEETPTIKELAPAEKDKDISNKD